MRRIDRLRPKGGSQERMSPAQWANWMTYNGARYYLDQNTTYGKQEKVRTAAGADAITSNGVVFAVVRARASLLAQASLRWRRIDGSYRATEADMFTTPALNVFDDLVDILTRIEYDWAQTGNSFWVMTNDRLTRLRPDWVTIVTGSSLEVNTPEQAPDAYQAGIIYQPPDATPIAYLPGEYVHLAPYPDPDSRWRGMSYLRPVLVDIDADQSSRIYTRSFFENSATPNMVVKFPPEVQKATVEAFKDLFLDRHQGSGQAFKTAFLGGGADPVVLGSSLKDLDQIATSQVVQSNICAAAGVPPVVINSIAGIEQMTYANYSLAMRAFADLTVRPLWQLIATKFRPMVTPKPRNAELWYDVSGVSALQQDARDDAQIVQMQASTIRNLTDGGFDPASAVSAVVSGNLGSVVHTGLLSVQLLPPAIGSQPDEGLGALEGGYEPPPTPEPAEEGAV